MDTANRKVSDGNAGDQGAGRKLDGQAERDKRPA